MISVFHTSVGIDAFTALAASSSRYHYYCHFDFSHFRSHFFSLMSPLISQLLRFGR